jgi:hypothetical protein
VTEKAQIIAIAEACGWKWIQTNFEAKSGLIGTDSPHSGNIPYQGTSYPSNRHLPTYGKAIPDYLNDLNAMHEAEKVLPRQLRGRFQTLLAELSLTPYSATAAQRAEAFLRTLDLWKP